MVLNLCVQLEVELKNTYYILSAQGLLNYVFPAILKWPVSTKASILCL